MAAHARWAASGGDDALVEAAGDWYPRDAEKARRRGNRAGEEGAMKKKGTDADADAAERKKTRREEEDDPAADPSRAHARDVALPVPPTSLWVAPGGNNANARASRGVGPPPSAALRRLRESALEALELAEDPETGAVPPDAAAALARLRLAVGDVGGAREALRAAARARPGDARALERLARFGAGMRERAREAREAEAKAEAKKGGERSGARKTRQRKEDKMTEGRQCG